MDYKAIMLDVDGTLIPYDYEALPSKRVVEAIKKAKELVAVCVVTGRSYRETKRILDSIGINTGYAVADGGAYVIDIKTDKIIYKQYITKSDLKKIIKVFEEEKVDFFVKDSESFKRAHNYYEPYKKGQELEKVTMIFTDELYALEKTHEIMRKLSSPTLTIHRSKHKDPNFFGFNATHINATKLHGIVKISELLHLEKKEIIGVGDGYNDYPLLMASGLKVAMGNAVKDLKAIADYVAPSVTDDGVAVTIEKYILNSK